MTTAIALRGRLPGVRCDPALPRRLDDAIRLDVAALVGFAERGPVDDPQLVEDWAQYAAVFGGDLPLAVDERGVPVHAALPDAVRSFFDNGGRRAYVVRVVGDGAVEVDDVPVRVTSRRPLGNGRAITGLVAATAPVGEPPAGASPLALRAATPGGWAARLAVDVDVVDTTLALVPARDDGVALTAASRLLLDEGDAVLVRRDTGDPVQPVRWELLWVPPGSGAPVEPADGWQPGDVARLLRAELTVRVVDGDVATTVDRFEDVRLGPGTGRSTSWADLLQPAGGGFRRDRSMHLRAPDAAVLVPVLGDSRAPVPPAPAPDVPPECSRAALEAEGLADFDPVALLLDPTLTGHTVEGLRRALELLDLAEQPPPRGLHAVALQRDVAVVAVPDLYHRPWVEQAVEVDPGPPPPDPPPEPAPVPGFHGCDVPPDPEPPPPTEAPPPAVRRMVVEPPGAYDPAGLHAVATALVELCAARADMVAVLGLPRHAGLPEARHLADLLASRWAATTDVPSYAGIWHPWAAVAETRSPSLAPLRPVPPDGAAAGTIAAVELARGWWVEPAGRPLAGVLAADPFDHDTTVALFDRGLNVVHRRPAGFVASSAHTLSPDRSLLQLSVRRLLIYVRKLALREGARLVFEPDGERLRAQVQDTFTRALERLRVAGALAAHQVVVDRSPSRTLAGEGSLRVELKLAPTSPIEFVTVTLLRAGDGLLQVEGGA